MEITGHVESSGSEQLMSQSQPTDVARYLSVFVDALYHHGVENAVICPGSRSTPLALAIKRCGAIRSYVLMDERSAAFFALGIAKASNRPTILLSTSGTAAANFLPAVVESFWGHVPLIVLTADRPPELRDSGASQTIDQVGLFGSHSKWFQDMPITDGSEQLNRFAAITAGRAVHYASNDPKGPVHLNFPFREPLIIDPLPKLPQFPAIKRITASIPRVDSDEIAGIAQSLSVFRHGLILAGPGPLRLVLDQIVDLSQKLGWPIFADPLSNIRGLDSRVMGTYDAFLRVNRQMLPHVECVIRLGAPMTSKTLNLYTADSYIYTIDGENSYREPQMQTGRIIEGRIEDVLTGLSEALNPLPTESDPDWYPFWFRQHETIMNLLRERLTEPGEASEPYLYYHLCDWLRNAGSAEVFVSNSMPVRDLDTFTQDPDDSLRFWGNRGANGIDGIVSTAMGIAVSTDRKQTILITGDLAFYHDMNGLFAAMKYRLNVLIIVVNNDGGGIFSFLPQGQLEEQEFESLFGTPHGLNFEHAALLYQAAYRRASTLGELRRGMEELLSTRGLRILEWRTPSRKQNVALHNSFWI